MARGGFRGKSQFDRMIDDYGFGGSVKKVRFQIKIWRSEAKKARSEASRQNQILRNSGAKLRFDQPFLAEPTNWSFNPCG